VDPAFVDTAFVDAVFVAADFVDAAAVDPDPLFVDPTFEAVLAFEPAAATVVAGLGMASLRPIGSTSCRRMPLTVANWSTLTW
jgi:hypothetical protein